MTDSADSSSLFANDAVLMRVITRVIARRASGESVSDDQVIAEHPSLMPRIRDELRALNQIHRAVLFAGNVNPLEGGSATQSRNGFDKPFFAPEYEEAGHTSRELRIAGFRLLREINSGGQATVYQAIQERTGRIVAVKVVHGGPFAGSRNRARFDRESIILAKLNHPYVVSILDKGRTFDGSFYLVMEFIDGTDLDAHLGKLHGNTPAIVRLFIKIANAVEEAHRHGIVHRDLKPMNIRIDLGGEPHILDFGMARIFEGDDGKEDFQDSLTRTGQVLGSLLWCSPEQVQATSEGVDARSDVYSLGVMLFKALAGEFPYPITGGLHEILKCIISRPPTPLMAAAMRNKTVVGKSLDLIVTKALEKAPSQRYGSAGLLALDLEKSLSARAHLMWKVRRGIFGMVIPVAILILLVTTLVGSSPEAKGPLRPQNFAIRSSAYFNHLGMKFVRLPAGIISLEIPDENAVKYAASRAFPYPAHKPFSISVTPVTREFYFDITGKYPDDVRMRNIDFPVTHVTWKDAMEFCQLLSHREGRTYRLPDIYEWEYAFCAGDNFAYRDLNLDSITWYGGNSGNSAHEVAMKSANPWGLFDMVGNVQEWCSNLANSTGTPLEHGGDPDSAYHIAEGIDYSMPLSSLHAPTRSFYKPETALPTVGFRVVCDDGGN